MKKKTILEAEDRGKRTQFARSNRLVAWNSLNNAYFYLYEIGRVVPSQACPDILEHIDKARKKLREHLDFNPPKVEG